ncbi:hypothetical protein, partial [Alcanivorax sp. 1008]|uniref:hypothetical protein n=1 Tax=Alcanivorax sp. 1008 TaxID=2816853 RepID=UPI001D6C3329
AIPPMFHDGIRNATASKAKWFLCFADTRNQDGWVDLNNLPSDVLPLRSALLTPEGAVTFNRPRPDSSGNPFCLSCHTDDGSGHRPASLLVDALIPSSLLMQDDPRRQPIQPPAKVYGNLPAGTWGTYPLVDMHTGPGGHPIDEFIAPPSP